MDTGKPESSIDLTTLAEAIRDHYDPANSAHRQYSVYSGKRSEAYYCEFEHALSHLTKAISGDGEGHLHDFASHCDRITIEAYEYIAEEMYNDCYDRFKTCCKYPKVASRYKFDEEKEKNCQERLRQMKDLIEDGRR